MKSKLILFISLFVSFSARAENNISSCEKYFAALESCIGNVITFYSEKDKELLKINQNNLKEVKDAQAAIRKKREMNSI